VVSASSWSLGSRRAGWSEEILNQEAMSKGRKMWQTFQKEALGIPLWGRGKEGDGNCVWKVESVEAAVMEEEILPLTNVNPCQHS